MTSEGDTILEHAREAYGAGLCIVPPKEDGSKAPISAWKDYQQERPSPEQMREWYGPGTERHGMGVVCGAVSGGLELTEFDAAGELYEAYKEAAQAIGLGDVVERIEAGFLAKSAGGGFHWLYRCEDIGGNTKLARRPKRPEEQHDPNDKVQVLIETRGEGGYAILPPSHGGVHPTGNPYQLLSGGFSTIATITPEERKTLHDLARTFDTMPHEERPEAGPVTSEGGRPGDAFNASADWREILEPHGWKWVFHRDGVDHWRRPGKNDGISATTNHAGSGLLYVFSSSTIFESERGYSPFSAYAVLNHNGDYAAAAKDLAAKGYGERHEPPSDAQAAPRTLPFRTAVELAALAPERPEWVVEGLLAQRAITELSAKVKTGKTTFDLAMMAAMLSGDPFLGLPTHPTAILYLTEERQDTFREALERSGLLDASGLHILHLHDVPKAMTWAEVVAAAVHYARDVGAGVLVVDTLSRWAKVPGDDENSSGAAAAAMEPVEYAAAAGLAVMVVRHDRKSGGDIGDSGRGSSAFSGAADIVLALRRATSTGHETRRTLEGVGRFSATPNLLTLELQDGKYVSLGDAMDVERAETRAKTLDVLPDTSPGMTEAMLLEKTGATRSTLKRALKELLQDGSINQAKGAGDSGKAYGYWRNELSNELSNKGLDPGQLSKAYASKNGVPNQVSSPRTPGQKDEVSSPQSLIGHNVENREVFTP